MIIDNCNYETLIRILHSFLNRRNNIIRGYTWQFIILKMRQLVLGNMFKHCFIFFLIWISASGYSSFESQF